MSDLSEMFFQECAELVEALGSGLNELESDGGNDETVNGMFRAVHSIKGGAGAFGLDQLVAFAHAMENVLDDIRSGRLAADENVVALLFSASDHLSDLVDAARDETDLPPESGLSILADLQAVGPSGGSAPPLGATPEEDLDAPVFEPLQLCLDADLTDLGDDETKNTTLHIRFKPHAKLYANGHDPALLFRTLEQYGETRVTADVSSLRPLSEGDWTEPGLRWSITLVPHEAVTEFELREVFEFVEGLCDLDIKAATPALHPPGPDNLDLPELPAFITEAEASQEAPKREATDQEPPGSTPKPRPRTSTIRVDLSRVDRLINLVGELVIAEAMLRQSMDALSAGSRSGVDDAINQLKQLSGEIQESVMAIRAQPVRSLFQRMSRIVREASKEAGKKTRLETRGDATEIDKTVIERLVEPLTHMVRNAIDHGLELPQDRIAANKDERGVVTLAAAHRSGRVIISLSDDGAGINREKVRSIAEEKGLIRADDDLTDQDIDNLLFRPGFSTASAVSSLSGRGVGMDVVRNEIQSLGGRVTLQSEPGKGTTVTISLPLTLAVLEGMVVRVDDHSLIVPTLPLREMLQPGQAKVHTLCGGDRVLSLNGELVPITDLGAALGYRAEPGIIDQQALLLIEGDSGRRSALAVDAIAEQREVVIKGLEQNYQSIPGIAAATILGDGKIALIVDTDQMVAVPGRECLPPRIDVITAGGLAHARN